MPQALSIDDFAKRYLDPVAQELGRRAESNVLASGISRRNRKFKAALRAEVTRLCHGPELLDVMKEMESRLFPGRDRLLQAIRDSL